MYCRLASVVCGMGGAMCIGVEKWKDRKVHEKEGRKTKSEER